MLARYARRLVSAALVCCAALQAQYTIQTVAGAHPDMGDGGPAKAALLRSAFAVAADRGGNTYVVDQASHTVRRISPQGSIATVSGTGIPASSALSSPSGVAVDAAGNIYISDTGNFVVRRVSPDGAMRTVAGTGEQGGGGDDWGSATAAALGRPEGLAVDGSGNLYIADSANHVVRKMTPSGIITTVAGAYYPGFLGDGGLATQALLDTPQAVAVDSSGNVYVSDSGNQRVRKVASDGVITTVAGNGVPGYSGDGGPAVAAMLEYPRGLACDPAGNLYIAVTYSIRKVTPAGIISTVAGRYGAYGFSGDGGPAGEATFARPNDVAIDKDGGLIVADYFNKRVRRVDPQGTIETIAGRSTENLPLEMSASSAYFDYPAGLAAGDGAGILVADLANNRVRAIGSAGEIGTRAGTGAPGNSGDGGPATSAALLFPTDVAQDAAGNLYIADSANSRVRKVAPDGTITTVAGTGNPEFNRETGPAATVNMDVEDIAVARDGTLYVADRYNSRIRRITPAGTAGTIAGHPQWDPASVAVDPAGNVYVADYSNNRVLRVTPAGAAGTVAGNGLWYATALSGPATSLSLSPSGLAADADGNVFIADADNEFIWKLAPSGTLSVVAGGGLDGTGENIPATAARLHGPYAVAVDGNGGVYVSETGNPRLRRGLGLGLFDLRYAVSGSHRVRKLIPGSPIACPYSLDPAQATVAAAPGQGSLTVNTAPGCIWSATANVPWLIASTNWGIGAGTLQFAFARNTGGERTGTLTIAGHTFTVTQVAAASTTPVFSAGAAVVNGGSFLPGVSPGAWVTVFGTNLAPVPPPGRIWRADEIVNGQLPVSMEGVSTYVAAVQAIPDADNTPTYIGYPELLPGVRARLARPGDLISLYGTGFGPAMPPRPAGQVFEPAPLANRVRVFLGEQEAEVLYSGLVAPGLNQVNIRVPDLPSGDYLVRAEVSGAATQPLLFLTVQR